MSDQRTLSLEMREFDPTDYPRLLEIYNANYPDYARSIVNGVLEMKPWTGQSTIGKDTPSWRERRLSDLVMCLMSLTCSIRISSGLTSSSIPRHREEELVAQYMTD